MHKEGEDWIQDWAAHSVNHQEWEFQHLCQTPTAGAPWPGEEPEDIFNEDWESLQEKPWQASNRGCQDPVDAREHSKNS